MSADARIEGLRRRFLEPWSLRVFLWTQLPLAGFAGLRLRRLDETGCAVSLPGGWRTKNPFRSTYFAAQAMAAEMSTGAPALLLTSAVPASMSMLVREVRGVFNKKVVGESTFTFSDVAGMRSTIERAAVGDEGGTFIARSTGRTADGTVVAEFEITWSFRRRNAEARAAPFRYDDA